MSVLFHLVPSLKVRHAPPVSDDDDAVFCIANQAAASQTGGVRKVGPPEASLAMILLFVFIMIE